MSDSATPRRKSERTRAAIREAAARLFAEQGYERTTMRDIAAAAAIDPAMVIRYFGSKDALFAETATFELGLPEIAELDPKDLGATLVRRFLEIWEGDGAGSGLAVLLRSAASNEDAARKLREVFARQVMPAIAATGDPATAPARAGLVATQLLGLAMCRYILRLPPVVAMDAGAIVARIGPTVARYALGES